MGLKKFSNKKSIQFIAFLITIIVLIIYRGGNEEESKRIIEDGKTTIGTVIKYSSGKGSMVAPTLVNQPGKLSYVRFRYTVDGKEYINQYDDLTSLIPAEGIKIGDKFRVVYMIDDPEKSRMIFDKPVNSNSDSLTGAHVK